MDIEIKIGGMRFEARRWGDINTVASAAVDLAVGDGHNRLVRIHLGSIRSAEATIIKTDIVQLDGCRSVWDSNGRNSTPRTRAGSHARQGDHLLWGTLGG